MTRTLAIGSLFSGIGGLDLGLERAGMRVVWQSEIDPYCCRVLAKHWPDIPNLGDVTTIDWTEVPRVDVICGGYPCQPFSVAGRRQGEQDPRHLWPRMLDAVRVLRPRYAVMENVAGHLALGFGRVLGDLAEIGYDTEWDCIPAAALGAPHRRDRVFIVAWPQQRGNVADTTSLSGSNESEGDRPGFEVSAVAGPSDRTGRGHLAAGDHVDRRGPGVVAEDVADTDGTPRGDPGSTGETLLESETIERFGRRCSSDDVADSYGEPLGWPPITRPERHHWTVEPDVGRVAHGISHRVDRLRTLGNAVVPQIAEHIGRLIVQAAA